MFKDLIPYTVFAPVNDAFVEISQSSSGAEDDLFVDEDEDDLTDLLLGHMVVSKRVEVPFGNTEVLKKRDRSDKRQMERKEVA